MSLNCQGMYVNVDLSCEPIQGQPAQLGFNMSLSTTDNSKTLSAFLREALEDPDFVSTLDGYANQSCYGKVTVELDFNLNLVL